MFYSSQTIQENDLIENILKVIQEENGQNIEVAVHAEAAFQKYLERKSFIKTTTENMKNRENITTTERYQLSNAPPNIETPSPFIS